MLSKAPDVSVHVIVTERNICIPAVTCQLNFGCHHMGVQVDAIHKTNTIRINN